MGAGAGRQRRAQSAVGVRDATTRLAAFKEFKSIVESLRGVKLQAAEADTLEWAAEGVLLAPTVQDEEAQECLTAFTTLVDDLESHRWAEMVGTPEHPGTSTRLRQAMAGCSPDA